MARPKKGEEHPREECRDRIKRMVAIGIPQDDIARVLRMSLRTMHEFYKEELEVGAAEANEVVGGRIFQAAASGEQWACALWAARRMGWKETQQVEMQATYTVGGDRALPATTEEWLTEVRP